MRKKKIISIFFIILIFSVPGLYSQNNIISLPLAELIIHLDENNINTTWFNFNKSGPCLATVSQNTNKTGILKGRILNALTKTPVPDALITLEGTSLSTVTDSAGEYRISGIPVGTYPIIVTAHGFRSYRLPEQLILAGQVSIQNIELVETPYDAEEKVTVEADYFEKKAVDPLSQFRLDRTEINRIAGTIEDINRVLTLFPSVAHVNELSNDLIVRGGSPFETGFYLEGIPVSNINHFRREGGSGGALSILNPDLIENVDFSAGGFSAIYGDRLSSIVDIKFRQGRVDRIASRVDLNISGFGLSLEGPLPGGKGSWILSGKRSYYDLLSEIIDIGIVPNLANIHAKVDYQLTPRDRISLIDVFGACSLDYGIEVALEEEMNYATNAATNQNTLGIIWQHIWGDRGYSETSLSSSYVKDVDTLDDPLQRQEYMSRDEDERTITLRNTNVIRVSSRYTTEFGFEIHALRASFNNYYSQYVDKWGLEVPGLEISGRFKESLSGLFTSHRLSLLKNLSMVIGLRGDYFSFNKRIQISPRASLSWKAGQWLTLNFGGGVFRQTLYPLLLVRNPQGAALKDPLAIHLIAGADIRLGESTKMTLEFYDKNYQNMPQTPDDPTLFILDNNVSMSGYFLYDRLSDGGRATSRGVELFLQKKFGDHLSTIISASLFKARYRDFDGIWRDRIYDNRILLNVIGHYRPGNHWEFNFRWSYAGGIPYTPFDVEKSNAVNFGILDRTNYYSERYPAYHSLFIRVDRQFSFKGSVLSVYLSLVNAYNRKNIARYYWDRTHRTVSVIEQVRRIPVFGIELTF